MFGPRMLGPTWTRILIYQFVWDGFESEIKKISLTFEEIVMIKKMSPAHPHDRRVLSTHTVAESCPPTRSPSPAHPHGRELQYLYSQEIEIQYALIRMKQNQSLFWGWYLPCSICFISTIAKLTQPLLVLEKFWFYSVPIETW